MAGLGPSYPVSLVLTGRSVLVVGGGRVALRKIRGLLDAGAEVTVVAPEVSDEIAALDGVQVIRRSFEPGDLEGRWLAVEATGDPQVAAAVAAAAEQARVWLNAADQTASCSVTLPAILRSGAVTVSYSTAGTSPSLAVWMRDRARDQYGPEYGILAALLSELRDDLHARGLTTEALDWRAVLDSGILDDVHRGRIAEAKERLQAWLSSSSE